MNDRINSTHESMAKSPVYYAWYDLHSAAKET